MRAAIAAYRSPGMPSLEVRNDVAGDISERMQEVLPREALHMVAEGGDAGLAHLLDQFGPTLELPWTELEAPELSDALRRRMLEGAAGRGGIGLSPSLERQARRAPALGVPSATQR